MQPLRGKVGSERKQDEGANGEDGQAERLCMRRQHDENSADRERKDGGGRENGVWGKSGEYERKD